MKRLKMLAIGLACVLSLGSAALAEEHDLDAMTTDELKAYIQELESENAALKEQLGDGAETEVSDGDGSVVTDYIKNYTGLNLASVGYTSMGGDRRDYYGSYETMLLVLTPLDGSFLDPEEEELLQAYTVVGQDIAPGTPVEFTYNSEEELENQSYVEIVLFLEKNGEPSGNAVPELASVSPSTDKTIKYVKDYTGRNLAAVGYTAMNGNRYDRYDSYYELLKISVVDESGAYIDTEDKESLKNYIVVGQNLEPNTEVQFSFDDEGNVVGQTVDMIQLTVSITEAGAAAAAEAAAAESELEAFGAVTELFANTYIVGTDLEAGNYELRLTGDRCVVQVFPDDTAYASGEETVYEYMTSQYEYEYVALKDGMYLKLDGAIKAIRHEDDPDQGTINVYAGVKVVGEDIDAGMYDAQLVGDRCVISIYDDEESYQDGDESVYEYMTDKKELAYFCLRDGMIIKTDSGITLTAQEAETDAGRLLYAGSYLVGTDLPAGNYEMSLISERCVFETYRDETAYNAENEDIYDYLTGDDTGFYNLTDGMYISVDGALLAAAR